MIASAAIVAAGAVWSRPGPGCSAAALDAGLLAAAAAWRNGAATQAATVLTWAGSLAVLGPLAAAIALWLGRRGERNAAWLIAVAPLGTGAVNAAVKGLLDCPRPPVAQMLIAAPLDASYPSSHAAQITAFCVAVLFAMSPGTRRAGACIAAAAAIAIVCATRIYLGVHYPSDIAAGLAAGWCWTLALAGLCGVRWRRATPRGGGHA